MNTESAIQHHRVNFGYPETYTEIEVIKMIAEVRKVDSEWTYEAIPYGSRYVIQVRDEDNEIIGIL